MVAPSPSGSSPVVTAPKTLRGLNKPKCIQCGNVARSRCPYQSCKSCCARAENPCHIHVLKANATFPEKASNANSPVFGQQTSDPSASVSSHRVSSLRQLSSNFAQFNNVLLPVRKKPLTKKDAASINEWRFKKLKEFRDRNIEIENEAFDRYMKNVNLLEEIFSPELQTEASAKVEPSSSVSTEQNNAMILEMKLKLSANPARKDNTRKRICAIVDRGLENLRRCGSMEGAGSGIIDENPKWKGWNPDRASLISDLNEKLNKARNEEDLQSCLEMRARLTNKHRTSADAGPEGLISSKPGEDIAADDQKTRQAPVIAPLKLVTRNTLSDENLNHVDAYFSLLDRVEAL
ncbi:hypothetical protein MLD38_019710 [Melastoma candidum]|uniref:Uncharacterized protein n=1 Tax=Melastoma candidum TaxID=119954 RepID=A0ACB9R1D8_9MYRT|nr:hypothetical protein MLD38_019710 [Melastoma candidum]